LVSVHKGRRRRTDKSREKVGSKKQKLEDIPDPMLKVEEDE
jgi:hypothetical protein